MGYHQSMLADANELPCPVRPADLPSHAEASRIFDVLASETRLGILQLLRERPLCVNALAQRLGVSSSAISQHLRILRHAGAVTGEKDGYWVHYRLNEETLRRWREQIGAFLGQ